MQHMKEKHNGEAVAESVPTMDQERPITLRLEHYQRMQSELYSLKRELANVREMVHRLQADKAGCLFY